jgi:hypothetical protein
MNLIFKVFAIIYRTFDDRGLDLPYFRALVIVVFLFFIHIVSIGLLFNIPSGYIMPWNSQMSKWIQWLFAVIYFGTLMTFTFLVFNKKKVDKIPITEDEIETGRRILPIYITLSMIFLVILLVMSAPP